MCFFVCFLMFCIFIVLFFVLCSVVCVVVDHVLCFSGLSCFLAAFEWFFRVKVLGSVSIC